jgi:hypothetical protein
MNHRKAPPKFAALAEASSPKLAIRRGRAYRVDDPSRHREPRLIDGGRAAGYVAPRLYASREMIS